MQKNILWKSRILALGIAVILAATPALANKPEWAGDGKKDSKHDSKHKQNDNQNSYFDDHHRTVMHSYYTDQYRSGHCPPGLAKKHNGCMPPGQAKKWTVGQQLPREVIFFDLPNEVVVRLGAPPARHRYVRVANDILLLAVGTGMVVDAIENLGNY